MAELRLHRAGDRFRTTAPGLDSRHSFSFGPHYDPDNLSFGSLLVSNEDRLDGGAGFDRHAHRGVEIVTWVLAGTLEHEDSTGRRQQLTAGTAQRLRAGSGVHHAEHAARSVDQPGAHYVQMWLRSPDPDARPDYACADFGARLNDQGSPRLVTVATGDPTDSTGLTLDQTGTEFLVGRLATGTEAGIAKAAHVHVFVARGTIRIDVRPRPGGPEQHNALVAGDAARIASADGDIGVCSDADAEILVWRLSS